MGRYVTFSGAPHHLSWFGSYRASNLRLMQSRVEQALKKLKLRKRDVCLVGTGMSGAMSIPIIAYRLKMSYCLVRQSGCRSVYKKTPELIVGELRPNAFFLDDLIDSGGTFRRVKNVLNDEYNNPDGVSVPIVAIITLDSRNDYP